MASLFQYVQSGLTSYRCIVEGPVWPPVLLEDVDDDACATRTGRARGDGSGACIAASMCQIAVS